MPGFGIPLVFCSGKQPAYMKKTQFIATLTLTTTLAAATLYLLKQCRQKKRLAVVSEAGYETAYDVHLPLKYRR